MGQFAGVLTSSVGAVSRSLDTNVKGTPLVIYNPAGFSVSDVVEVTVEGLPSNVSVYNEKGVRVPHQVLGAENGAVRMLVLASAPAAGYAVYDIRKGGSAKASPALKASESSLENSVYRIALDGNGDIVSIVDKRNGKELVKDGKAIRLALFTENESFAWPAWEITKKTIDGEPVSLDENVKITVVEKGPLRASVCVERTHGESVIRQYIRLTEGGQSDRIDFVNDVDWQSTNALLKAEFPLGVANEKAVYDLGVGSVERGNNTETAYEVYAQQWADLTDADGSYGVSVLNDCKYGHSVKDSNMALTLIKSGTEPNPTTDQEEHVFTYAIYPHAEGWRAAGTVAEAYKLNQPLLVQTQTAEQEAFSYASAAHANVIVETIKDAEDGSGTVLRLYESENAYTKTKLTVNADFEKAYICNLLEETEHEASVAGKEIEVVLKPYEVVTVKVV